MKRSNITQLLILVFLINAINGYAQTKTFTKKYKGIKILTEIEVGQYKYSTKDKKYIYEFNQKGQYIKSSYINESGSIEWNKFFTYDKNGKIEKIEKSWTHNEYFPGRIPNKKYVLESYERNKKGKLMKFIEFRETDPSKLFIERTYEYNDKGKKVQEVNYWNGKFRSKDKLIRITGDTNFWETYDEQSRVKFRYNRTYKNGKIAKAEFLNIRDQKTTITTFDENEIEILEEIRNESNVLLSKVDYNKNGEPIKTYYSYLHSYSGKEEIYKHEYNVQGDLVKKETFINGKLDDIRKYEYQYDYKGNWISKKERAYYDSNNFKGTVMFIYKREIEYY